MRVLPIIAFCLTGISLAHANESADCLKKQTSVYSRSCDNIEYIVETVFSECKIGFPVSEKLTDTPTEKLKREVEVKLNQFRRREIIASVVKARLDKPCPSN
jgi:hypothetical protein